jgi:hypothetical protein
MDVSGLVFWAFVVWTAVVVGTATAWLYEAQIVRSYRRRNARLAHELEAARNRLAGARR